MKTEQIANLMLTNNIPFTVTYTGRTTRDHWDCFAFTCSINGESFDYYLGTGHGIDDKELTELAQKSGRSKSSELVRWKAKHPGEFCTVEPFGLVKKPTAADLLYSLIADSGACNDSFDEWCSDYGYDTDSRKAMDIYIACQTNASKLRKAMSRDLIAQCAAILEDY